MSLRLRPASCRPPTTARRIARAALLRFRRAISFSRAAAAGRRGFWRRSRAALAAPQCPRALWPCDGLPLYWSRPTRTRMPSPGPTVTQFGPARHTEEPRREPHLCTVRRSRIGTATCRLGHGSGRAARALEGRARARELGWPLRRGQAGPGVPAHRFGPSIHPACAMHRRPAVAADSAWGLRCCQLAGERTPRRQATAMVRAL